MYLKTLLYTLILTLPSFLYLSNTERVAFSFPSTLASQPPFPADYSFPQETENSLLLIPSKGETIAAAEAIAIFLDQDWDFYKDLQVSGYTATDDLWTILSWNTDPPSPFLDRVKIAIIGLEQGSAAWQACIDDIEERAKHLSTPVDVQYLW